MPGPPEKGNCTSWSTSISYLSTFFQLGIRQIIVRPITHPRARYVLRHLADLFAHFVVTRCTWWTLERSIRGKWSLCASSDVRPLNGGDTRQHLVLMALEWLGHFWRQQRNLWNKKKGCNSVLARSQCSESWETVVLSGFSSLNRVWVIFPLDKCHASFSLGSTFLLSNTCSQKMTVWLSVLFSRATARKRAKERHQLRRVCRIFLLLNLAVGGFLFCLSVGRLVSCPPLVPSFEKLFEMSVTVSRPPQWMMVTPFGNRLTTSSAVFIRSKSRGKNSRNDHPATLRS